MRPYQSSLIIAAGIVVAGSIAITSAWTGATSTPPGGNVNPPINVGSVAQTKEGDLGVNAFLAAGNASVLGNLGVGVSNPTAKLQVGGAVGGTDEFTIANTSGNAYLYAYSTANASASIGAYGASALSFILNPSGGNVGVGTTSPSQPLSVNGMIYSGSGGFKFPDGSVQTSAGGGGAGGLNNITTFTSSGTWTKPVGVTKVWVIVTGGGGGGYSDACANGGLSGGGGATAMELIDVSAISSVAVTVGAGGTASSCGSAGDGGTSSFGTYTSAGGGYGGSSDYTWGLTGPNDNGAPKPTTGTINLGGGSGEAGPMKGGSSYWGDGNYGAALTYGVGGGPNPGRNSGGGNGSPGGGGIVVVYEYK